MTERTRKRMRVVGAEKEAKSYIREERTKGKLRRGRHRKVSFGRDLWAQEQTRHCLCTCEP